ARVKLVSRSSVEEIEKDDVDGVRRLAAGIHIAEVQCVVVIWLCCGRRHVVRVIAEEVDGLWLAVFEQAEIFFGQSAHDASITVTDDNVDVDDAGGDLNGG